MRAAVITEVGAPISFEDIGLDDPQPGEVLLDILATGVCHSDLSIHRGVIPHKLPAIVGHEAAGRVVAIGADVDRVAVGDRAVVSWIPQCGTCPTCRSGRPQLCDISFMPLRGLQPDGSVRRHRADGSDVYAMGAVGAFAPQAVVPQEALVPVTTDLPSEVLALIGCAVLTGVGAARNTADVAPGDTVAVIGAGGVGLNIVQGARMAGAGHVVVVDTDPTKFALARRLGATATVEPQAARDTVRSVSPGGAHTVFEAVGSPATARAAFDLARPGGTAVLVGMAALDATVDLPLFQMVSQERKVVGSWFGSSDIQRDIPAVVTMIESGDLIVDELVTETARLDDLPEALERLAAGRALRTVIFPGD